MTESWDITTDTELMNAVRNETQYTTDQLPTQSDADDDPDLEGLLQSAKRVLSLKGDITAFYDDRGTAVALLGVTCAKAKGAVENSPVVTKDLGAQNVTFRASDGSSIQLDEYEEMTRLGLAESETADSATQTVEFTHTFYHG
jgi:hypothetical protein